MKFQENSKPIYLQIVDRLCDAVMSDTFAPGDRIPSVREAAAKFQVNANTMMRAYENMSQLGVIQNRRGIGFFITDDARTLIEEMRHKAFYSDEIQYFFDRINKMGITPDKLEELYTQYIHDYDNSQRHK